jgi:hypothetical protein
MHEHVAFGVKLFGLQNAFHRFELRLELRASGRWHRAGPTRAPIRRQKNPHQLVANSFRADLIDRRRIGHKRVPGFFIDLVIEHAAKRTARSMRKRSSANLFAGSPMRALICGDVGLAADKINHLAATGS